MTENNNLESTLKYDFESTDKKINDIISRYYVEFSENKTYEQKSIENEMVHKLIPTIEKLFNYFENSERKDLSFFEDDLKQEGLIGILDYKKKFDKDGKKDFTISPSKVILKEMKKYCLNNSDK